MDRCWTPTTSYSCSPYQLHLRELLVPDLSLQKVCQQDRPLRRGRGVRVEKLVRERELLHVLNQRRLALHVLVPTAALLNLRVYRDRLLELQLLLVRVRPLRLRVRVELLLLLALGERVQVDVRPDPLLVAGLVQLAEGRGVLLGRSMFGLRAPRAHRGLGLLLQPRLFHKKVNRVLLHSRLLLIAILANRISMGVDSTHPLQLVLDLGQLEDG